MKLIRLTIIILIFSSYISKAQKNVTSEAEYAYIDSIVEQIVNYL
tara:strand:+ start:1441 stop:1575 length:135 start_codon:yes stop_codon:yes gene_type:complete